MKIPEGLTESQVLEAIERAVTILAPSFVFGHYGVDDLKQQGYVFALEVLEKEKFTPGLPFENFIYSHLRNQFINLIRNKFRRSDAPCRGCHAGNPCNQAEGGKCAKYRVWLERNSAKANIANPVALDNVCDERERRTRVESTVESDAEIDEVLKLIDEKLPIELRKTYLQMRAGVSVPKNKRLQVEQIVKDIIREGSEECHINEDD